MSKTSETTICRLCLEPVTNYVCTDCLFENVNRWVDQNSGSSANMRVLLAGKHASLKRMLHQDTEKSFCVSCRGDVEEIACPCCYLYEMHSVVKSADPETAKKFERDFNFDLVFHHGIAQLTLWESIHGRLLSSRSFRPILISDSGRKTDMNTCDGCETTSEELSEVEGQWLCESCRDEGMFVY